MKKLLVAILFIALVSSLALFAQGAKETTEETVKYTDWGTYPIVEEPITIDVMVVQPPCVEDYNTNEFTKYMEEKTNVKINYIQVPEQARAEKLSLILASGDYPDAFLGFDITPDMENTYGTEEGLFMPLTKYYTPEYLPNLMNALNDFPGGVGFMTLLDGNVYSLPALEVCYHCTNAAKMYVYKPFLDALNLEVPTTTEEFYNVLKAIKTQDPNGNGKNDEIPLAGSIVGWNDQVERFILNSFCYCDLDTNTSASPEFNMGYIMNGKNVSTVVNTPEFREGLAYINKLYEEGLIYKGSFTQDSSQLTQLVESSAEPTVGFVAGGWRGQFSSLSGDKFANFQAIAPLEGPNGEQHAVSFLAEPGTGSLVISSDSKYAEAILRYYDYMYSTEGTLLESYGFEGDAWAWADDTDVGLDGNKAIWKQLKPWNDKDPQNVTFIQPYTYAQTSEFRLGQAVASEGDYYAPANNEKVLYDETHDLYKPYDGVAFEVPTLKYTTEETEEFTTVKTELANYIRQNAVKFMVGTLDVNNDAVWNKYISDLQKLRLNDVIACMQTAYDRQYK